MGKIRTVGWRRHVGRARDLRREDTTAEARLWACLRDRRLDGWKWRRQVPCGPFIADFLCEDARLIVELDGGQHAERALYDQRRTALLGQMGYRVIRFWNSEVLENRNGVCLTVLDACEASGRRKREGVMAGQAVDAALHEPPSPNPLPSCARERH